MITIQTQEQLQEAKNNTGKSLFLFSAKWCPDCVFIEPFLPEVEQKYSQYQFYYLDRDQWMDECIELGVMGIPSFLIFQEGNVIGRFISKDRKTQEEIEAFLAEHL